MNHETRKKVIEAITRKGIVTEDDPKIEATANEFPDEYSNDQEYVEFHRQIANLILIPVSIRWEVDTERLADEYFELTRVSTDSDLEDAVQEFCDNKGVVNDAAIMKKIEIEYL